MNILIIYIIIFVSSIQCYKLNKDSECFIDFKISDICYQCGAMFIENFNEIHKLCCDTNKAVRDLCTAWYRGRPRRFNK